MKNCIYCGKEIDANSQFCPYCGSALPKEEMVQTPVYQEQPVQEHQWLLELI